ncbi:hypothetical protein [Streptomyces sp. NRRL F-5755]|uniref:hypothetical protein n=1 Tax=Streptomyces sp. NRRL F-5755 TaxID=1519475 RepID=UPI001331B55C|nr:hypothetical protein [Streptomyces sp. NRRL F-5755]
MLDTPTAPKPIRVSVIRTGAAGGFLVETALVPFGHVIEVRAPAFGGVRASRAKTIVVKAAVCTRMTTTSLRSAHLGSQTPTVHSAVSLKPTFAGPANQDTRQRIDASGDRSTTIRQAQAEVPQMT